MSNKIGIIVSREFSERVRKKSFIITTILMPILMIALAAAPTLMMMHSGSDTKHIVVVDDTPGQFVGRALQSDKSVEYELVENISRQEASMMYNDGNEAFGVLWIGSNVMEQPDQVQLFTNTSSSPILEENISSQISDILRTAKLRSYDIENLDQIIADTDVKVRLQTMKNNGSGDEDSMEHTSSDMSMLVRWQAMML